MVKKITDFIDDKNGIIVSVQAYIPIELRNLVLAQIRADKRAGIKITWHTLVESACLAYLEERKQKPAAKKITT